MKVRDTRRTFLTLAGVSVSGCLGNTGRSKTVRWVNQTITRPEYAPRSPAANGSRFRPIGRTVDVIGPASEWSIGPGMRAVPDDGTTVEASPAPFRGSRSLLVEGRSGAPLIAEFDEPLDFRDAHLSVAIYPDKPETTGPFPVVLYAPDRQNRIVCRGNYHGYFESGWRRYDFSIDNVVGDPDPSRVQFVEFEFADENRFTRCWVDDIRVLARPDRGKVMFMFDDIPESAFTNGFRIMNEFGLRGSYGVITDIVGEEGRLSVDQLRRAERAGWDLVSHSKTGDRLTELSSDVQRRYLEIAKEWLQEHALDPAGAEHFVFPLAKYGRTSLANVSNFHEMAYIGGRGSAPALTDRLTIVRRPGRRRLPKLRRWLRATARHQNLLVLVFHTVNREFTETFRHLVAHVNRMTERNQIDVITPTELSALQSKFEAG